MTETVLHDLYASVDIYYERENPGMPLFAIPTRITKRVSDTVLADCVEIWIPYSKNGETCSITCRLYGIPKGEICIAEAVFLERQKDSLYDMLIVQKPVDLSGVQDGL